MALTTDQVIGLLAVVVAVVGIIVVIILHCLSRKKGSKQKAHVGKICGDENILAINQRAVVGAEELSVILTKYKEPFDKLCEARQEIGRLETENKHLKNFEKAILRVFAARTQNPEEAEKILKDLVDGDLEPLENFLTSQLSRVQLVAGEVEEEVTPERKQEIAAVSYVRGFYDRAARLDKLKGIGDPTRDDVNLVLEMTKDDDELTVHFYKGNTNPGWVNVLGEAGEFERLGGSDEEVGVCQEAQAKYLASVADKNAEEVLGVFTSVGKLHRYIRGEFVNALLNMPNKTAVKGVKTVLGYIRGKEKKEWYFVCYRAAKLMGKLAEKYPNESFVIAEELLEVWMPKDKKRMAREIESKFTAYEYEKIVFDFFSKLWEVDAYRSTELLVNILDRYIHEVQSGEDYEVTNLWYIHYERLEQIGERFSRDIVASLVGGICEAGKAVIGAQAKSVDELLRLLQGFDRQIFRRIEMYLLRFVQSGTQKERINEIIADHELRTSTGYKYEYKFLLRDRVNDLSENVVQEYLQWVDSKEFDKEEKENISSWFEEREERPAEDADYDEILNLDKARELYLVKEVFPNQYKEYKAKSKREEGEIAPKPMVGHARWVDPAEGAPLSIEEMAKMKPEEVIAYIIDEEKWKDKKSTSFFNTPEEALISAFGNVAQLKVDEYMKLTHDDLLKLKPKFLNYYFDGIWIALREKEANSDSWRNILESAKGIVEEKLGDEEFNYCFINILNLIEHKLEQKTSKEHHELIWEIIETLTKYEHNPDAIAMAEEEKDPYEESINCVRGKAFEIAIRFGIGCKKEISDYYEKTLSKQLTGVLGFLANENSLPKVVCVFGVWFVQLHWIEESWIQKNLDLIFCEQNIKRWDAVWGSYVTWGRPAQKAFNLLAERGKYKNAIEKIGAQNSFKYRKDIDEGLAEHLIIAFFNKWIDFDNELLKGFFCKAPAKLRGYAANFMTTGFKHIKESTEIKEEEKREYGERFKLYWQSRLDEISKAPKVNNIDETQEFAGWVKDSLIGDKETLNLLHKTLDLSDGKIGERVHNVEFVEGIYEATKGNEIRAIQCLKMAFNDPEMRMYSQVYNESLNAFFELIISLPDDYPDIVNIRKEAIVLVDNIGRLCPDLRDNYSKLYTALNEKIK